MTYERGAVVEAGDPFNEGTSTRPFLLMNTDAHPFYGEQYVAVTLTTRTWYEETIPLDDEDFIEGGVPAASSIVPWGVVSPAHEDVLDRYGHLRESKVDDAVEQLYQYLQPEN